MPAPTIPGSQPVQTRTSSDCAAAPEPRLDAQDRLMAVVNANLARSGKWARWCREDPRLAGVDSLEQAVEAWGRRDPRSYQVVAALTRIGSRHGGDDDDAALAVIAVLAPGIARLAAKLREVCEVDDIRTTVWEEVKLAEPQLGCRAPRYLLKRACQRLTRMTRTAAGIDSHGEYLQGHHVRSLDQMLGWAHHRGDVEARGGQRCPEPAAADVEDPVGDLLDLLTWARRRGVLQSAEADLIVQLLSAENRGLGTEDAMRLLGEQQGVAMRTIRRRRDAIVSRLREALPDYLAATA